MNRAIREILHFGRLLKGCAHSIIMPSWAIVFSLLTGCGETETGRYEPIRRPPAIRPDYASTVIPPNIAPLNFKIEEPGDRYRVKMHSGKGTPILIFGRSPSIKIPIEPWKRLLNASRGKDMAVEISAWKDGKWRRFDPFILHIANESIDECLVYRLIMPVFNHWKNMGIYQRNLGTFEEKALLRNAGLSSCINCHSFCDRSPSRWSLQMRYGAGGLLLVRNDTVVNVNSRTRINPFPAAYTAWHPGGKVIAFSVDKVAQFFHAKGENRDVIDLSSDLILYHVDSDSMSTSMKIASPDRMETLPDWSPDGKTLYYCSAPQLDSTFSVKADYSKVRYDLMRIPYDIQKNDFGDPETVLSSAKMNKSLSHPKVSPDGRFLLFCTADYGYFTIYRPESDLCMMDLKSKAVQALPVNSELCESYHSWSSNSRWFVFSSKRDDGICARPYFAYVDINGKAHKPFLLPQKDACFYDDYWFTYNVPELISGPVRTHERSLFQAAKRIDKVINAKPVSDKKNEKLPGPGSMDAREWQRRL
jgi:hypothetical protein